MTNYLDSEPRPMITFFANRSILQIYRKQNKENEKQNKNLHGMYRDTPEIEYIYRWRVSIRQLCNLRPSLSELFVISFLAKTARKKVRE